MQDGKTLVFYAAVQGRLDVIEYLVTKYKADPNRASKVSNRAYGVWCAGVDWIHKRMHNRTFTRCQVFGYCVRAKAACRGKS